MRPCDLLSLFITLSLNIPAYLLDNLILNNILAVAISIGSIKIFYFKSFKQSCLSMTISTVSVTIVAVVLHYILRRSYNDYAYELSSPLFIQVPDMVDNLYKKCSWLPVLDVLVPGVFLAYLRAYDENLGSKAFGVYTIWGNFFFLASTIVWVFVEAIYPFSVPFCLVTYPSVMVGVALVARIRNDLYKLW